MHTMTAATPQRMNAEEFMAWQAPDVFGTFELIDGEVVLTQPTPLHQHVAANILFHITLWTRGAPGRGMLLLPIDTLIDHWTVLVPDLQWYADGRELPGMTEPPWPSGDLVVEVRSPSTWHRDIGLGDLIHNDRPPRAAADTSQDHHPNPQSDNQSDSRAPGGTLLGHRPPWSTTDCGSDPKKEHYERDGVRELWLVDPFARTVRVHRRSEGSATFDVTAEVGGGETLTSPLLPGFAVPVAQLFG